MTKHSDEGGKRSRTYTFSLAVTRTDPEDIEETKTWFRRSLTPVDLMILGALAVVFALEPFAIYMLMAHYRGPLLAERCADGARVVLATAETPGPAGYSREPIDPREQDIVTPLNTRDPSSLIMSPYVYEPARVSRPEPADGGWKDATAIAVNPKPSRSGWKEAVSSAAKRAKARATEP